VVLSDSSSEDEAIEVYEAQEICLTLPAEHCRLLQILVKDHKQFLPVSISPPIAPPPPRKRFVFPSNPGLPFYPHFLHPVKESYLTPWQCPTRSGIRVVARSLHTSGTPVQIQAAVVRWLKHAHTSVSPQVADSELTVKIAGAEVGMVRSEEQMYQDLELC